MVVCRRASDPIPPGFQAGYQCSVCGLALLATARGREALKTEGSKAFCNSCGAKMIERLSEAGIQLNVKLTPQARAGIDRLFEELRKAR